MGTLDSNKIPKLKQQEVAVDNFNVSAYLKQKNNNIKSVKEESKPVLRGKSEKIDFNIRSFKDLPDGQKQTVINERIKNDDGLSDDDTYNRMLVNQSPNYVNKLISKVPYFGERAAGLLSKTSKSKLLKNDKGIGDFDKKELAILYKAAMDKSKSKEEGYRNIYGQTGDDYLKGSNKNLMNPSVNADMAGSAGRVRSQRNKHGELVIQDQYDFSKVGKNYKEQGIYGKLRYALGQNGEEPETGKTHVTIPKSMEEDLKRMSTQPDFQDIGFQKASGAIMKIPTSLKQRTKDILKDKKVQELINKAKSLAKKV